MVTQQYYEISHIIVIFARNLELQNPDDDDDM